MSLWEKLYKAYKNKNCEEFETLLNKATSKEKQSPYFSYYKSLFSKIGCEKDKKNKKVLIKGKTINCPSCGSPLVLDEYNKEQILKYKKQNKKEIEFICSYCGTKFLWRKKKFKSLFTGYGIGQEVEIDGKKYKLSGAVRYKGIYKEDGEVGNLEYIEWLGYDDKGKIYYIAESRAEDNYGIYKSLEVSEKINYFFKVKGFDENMIYGDEDNFSVSEYDEVEVVELIGEVGKGYKIGEKVKIYNFSYYGKYSLEEEKTENGIERNLYKVISESNPDYSNDFVNVGGYNENNKFEVSNTVINVIVFMLVLFSINVSLFFIAFIVLVIYLNLKSKNSSSEDEGYSAFIFYFSIVALSFFLGLYVHFLTLPKSSYSKTVALVNNIEKGNYEYKFNNEISKSKFLYAHSYGGQEYKKKILEGFYFSIKDENDKKVFEDLIKDKKNFDKMLVTSGVQFLLGKRKLSDIVDLQKDTLIKLK